MKEVLKPLTRTVSTSGAKFGVLLFARLRRPASEGRCILTPVFLDAENRPLPPFKIRAISVEYVPLQLNVI